MAVRPERDRYTTGQMFALLAAVFALLFSTVIALLAFDQARVLGAAERLQQQTVPEITRFQRLSRNLEKLCQEGERLFSSGTVAGRREALFMVMLIASHPGVLEHAPSADVARQAETFLVETGRLAAADPEALRARLPEWQALATRVNLLVDDILAQSVNAAAADLDDMTTAMRLAGYKLAGAMILVGAFLVLLLVLLRQQLLRPLQRIDQALSTLSVNRPAPDFPDTRVAEIHAMGEASKRLHSEMLRHDAARRKIEMLANRDDLTGLVNRRHFLVTAAAELRRARRYGHPVAVAFGDIDSFKRLNDAHGHDAGDVVLRTFASVLAESVRQSDLVCRYGGEEFALLFPESTVEQARILLERFRERVANLAIRLPDGVQVRVTLSIGLADASHREVEVALKRADLALYEAKRRGRNQVVVASEVGAGRG